MAAKYTSDTLLTLPEAARYLGKLAHRKPLHVDVVRRWVTRGVRGEKLPHVRFGDVIMLRVGDIAAWLDRKNRPAPEPAIVRQSPSERPARPGHHRAMNNLAAAGLVAEGGAA